MGDIDILRVHVDVDGGRGCVGTWMHCVWVRMDCLGHIRCMWTQISVNKKKNKKKELTDGKRSQCVDVLCVHADMDGGCRHLACACGHGWGTWTPCVCVRMDYWWTQMSINKK